MNVLHINSSVYTCFGFINLIPGKHFFCNHNYDLALSMLKLQQFDFLILEQSRGINWLQLQILMEEKKEAKVIVLTKQKNDLFLLLVKYVCTEFYIIDMHSHLSSLKEKCNEVFFNIDSLFTFNESLTCREFVLLVNLSKYVRIDSIAKLLCVSKKTVYTLKYNLIRKMKYKSIRGFEQDLSNI